MVADRPHVPVGRPLAGPRAAGAVPLDAIGLGGAYALVSRSTQAGSKWLTITLRLEPEVRARWEKEVADPVDHIYVQLSNYLLLREWYDDDLGVLYLK